MICHWMNSHSLWGRTGKLDDRVLHPVLVLVLVLVSVGLSRPDVGVDRIFLVFREAYAGVAKLVLVLCWFSLSCSWRVSTLWTLHISGVSVYFVFSVVEPSHIFTSVTSVFARIAQLPFRFSFVIERSEEEEHLNSSSSPVLCCPVSLPAPTFVWRTSFFWRTNK